MIRSMTGLMSIAALSCSSAAFVACSNASEPKSVVDTISPGGCLCEPVVSPTAPGLSVHGTVQISASDRLRPNAAWRWTSRDTTVAVVTQTGIVTAIRGGTSTITAAETADTSARASSLVTVSNASIGAFDPVIASVSDVATGGPTNLAAIRGSVAVGAQIIWPAAGAIGPAQLLVRRASGDTVVASIDAPVKPSSTNWTGTLIWNTSARAPAGTAVFPNGGYRILVQTTINGAVVVASSSLQVSVTNP